jgi:hypothetical protein
MEQAGVALHKDQLEDLIKESTEKANALKDELAEEWGINPGCGKQLIEHFELEARHGWPKTKGRQTEDRSGAERIRGHEKMREFQEAYPTPPCTRLRRVLVRDGLWVAEGVIDYGGGRVSNIAVIFELKDGKI